MRTLLCILCSLSTALIAGAPDFYIRDGDTVVFFGDSITSQRIYTVYTEAYVLTRFPQLHVRFIHSGWSGDRVTGGHGGSVDERLQRDVLAYHPSVVTIMLGMNDGEYRPYDKAIFDRFANGYRHIFANIRAQAPQARLTLLEPSPYDDVTRPPDFPGGYNSVLLKYGEFVRNLAHANGLGIAEVNAPAVRLLRSANKISPKLARTLIPDRVHPNAGVHLIMAEKLLQSWYAPAVVTTVEIDGSAAKVIKAENTTVDSVTSAGALSWNQTDGSLPFEVESADPTIKVALQCSDVTATLNLELLKVTRLTNATYRLQIDDDAIGNFSAAQLARGINLATLPTPMSKQARSVLDLTYRHNHLRFALLRMLEDALTPYGLKKLPPAVEALDALEQEVVSLQRATAIPKLHRYRLSIAASNVHHGAHFKKASDS